MILTAPNILCAIIISLQIVGLMQSKSSETALNQKQIETISDLVEQNIQRKIQLESSNFNDAERIKEVASHCDTSSINGDFIRAEIADQIRELAKKPSNLQDEPTPEEIHERDLAVATIEAKLDAAISRGGWTAEDSESIIPHSYKLSYEERVYLLDRFAEAVDMGLTSAMEFPPPI